MRILLKKLVLLSSLLVSTNAYSIDLSGWENWNVTKWNSKDFKFIDVSAVYLDFMHYTWAVDPFLQPTLAPTNRFDLHLDMELLNRTFFFNNMIHSETDQYQYRLIGWNYRFGVHLGNYVDLYIEHFSQHLLDIAPATANTYEAIGLRVYFYRTTSDPTGI
jgi:hypothetical protein